MAVDAVDLDDNGVLDFVSSNPYTDYYGADGGNVWTIFMQAPYVHTISEDCDDGNGVAGDGCSPDYCQCDGIFYQDADGDGYANDVTQLDCAGQLDSTWKLAGDLIATTGDCDDDDARINPATTWYLDDDDDGFSEGTNIVVCANPDVSKYYLASELIGNTHTQTTLDDGLVGYWSFDYADARDESGNGNT